MWGRRRLNGPYRWLSTAGDKEELLENPEFIYSEVTGEIRFLPDEPVDVILPRKATK